MRIYLRCQISFAPFLLLKESFKWNVSSLLLTPFSMPFSRPMEIATAKAKEDVAHAKYAS